jgi:hypothetical protein
MGETIPNGRISGLRLLAEVSSGRTTNCHEFLRRRMAKRSASAIRHGGKSSPYVGRLVNCVKRVRLTRRLFGISANSRSPRISFPHYCKILIILIACLFFLGNHYSTV